jgi:hypothetical protein
MAYEEYILHRNYITARRIYSANQEVYEFLRELLYSTENVELSSIIQYMFHLEDWFAQFENKVERDIPELEDKFVFERLNGAMAFPKDFENQLNLE